MDALLLLEAAEMLEEMVVPCSPGDSWSGESDRSSTRRAIRAPKHGGQNGKTLRRTGQRDAHAHNTIEKRRRAEVSANYAKLKAQLVGLGPKASNVAILQAASEEVARLTEEEQDLLAALHEERARNQDLRALLGMPNTPAEHDSVVPSLERARPVLEDFQTAPSSPASGLSEEPAFDGLMLLAALVNQHADAKAKAMVHTHVPSVALLFQ